MPQSKNLLSPVEWEVMNIIWKLGERPTVREVVDAGYPNGEKAYTTVHTIMGILEKKGFLKREMIGQVYFYTPLRTRDSVLKKETKNFAQNVFQSSSNMMARYLLKSNSFTTDEIDSLKEIIKEKEKEARDNKDV